MSKNRKNIVLSSILFFLSGLCVILFVFNYIIGPHAKQSIDEQDIHNEMMRQISALSGSLLQVYDLNETTYVSQIKNEEGEFYIWYNEELVEFARHDTSLYDEQSVLEVAQEYQLIHPTISLGYYKGKAVVVVEDDTKEVLLDFLSLSEELVYEKKVVY